MRALHMHKYLAVVGETTEGYQVIEGQCKLGERIEWLVVNPFTTLTVGIFSRQKDAEDFIHGGEMDTKVPVPFHRTAISILTIVAIFVAYSPRG